MRRQDCRISVAEFSFSTGPKKSIKINIDGKDVGVPIDQSVYAYFSEQFLRENPTPRQRQRFATIMNVARAAYQKGYVDGKGHHRN